MILDLSKVILEVDTQATRKFYQTEPHIHADCFYCENYVLAMQHDMKDPDQSVSALLALGIDPLRIARTSYIYAPNPSSAVYDCTAFVVAEILTYDVTASEILSALTYEGLTLCIQKDRRTFYNTGRPLPKGTIQLSYQLAVRWVLTQKSE